MNHLTDLHKIPYQVEGNKLIFDDGNVVIFDYPVKKVIDASSVLVVLLRTPTGIIFNENVYGISNEGTILWQVAPRKHLDSESPYTDISFTPDGHIGLYNWDAGFYIIDSLTGKVLMEKFAK